MRNSAFVVCLASLTAGTLCRPVLGAAGQAPMPTAVEFLDVRTVEHTHFLERRNTSAV